jgi:DNA-binding NtrC family response regulator
MRKEITALLVHDQTEHMWALASMLRHQEIYVHHVHSCQAARCELACANPPQLVFTDTDLHDGKWPDVVLMAEGAIEPVNVIVVARFMNEKLYIEALEGGAFDFIVPPFASFDLAHVVQCAADNVLDRRGAAPQERIAGRQPLLGPMSSMPEARTPGTAAKGSVA